MNALVFNEPDFAPDAVAVDKIAKSYGEKKALHSLSLRVKEGELFGLIGPDGAGKTSLFRILATLLLADEGRATIKGLDTVSQYKEVRNRIGYMPGRFSLYQDLSVEENLNFFARVFHTSIEENYELIRAIYVQIEPFKDRKAGKLSGGMKQKLALCCSLIHRPEVLLLDEPTTGVDPVSRKEFWEMLRTLKQEGITILVSTPYMDEAGLCDRIGLMQEGRLLSVGSPEQIVASYPGQLYSVSSDDNYSLLLELRARPEVTSCYIFGESLHLSFRDKALDIPGLKAIGPGVEDCFIQLTSDQQQSL